MALIRSHGCPSRRWEPAIKAMRLLAAWLAACLLTIQGSAASPKGVSSGRPPDIAAQLRLRNIGPAFVGGRVSAVTGIPGDPDTFYVGAASGGVWKTTDGGDSWEAIFTHEDSSSIGAIAVAASDPKRVWVGTGEADIRNDVIDGSGVYYSPDAGKTWRRSGLADAGQIGRIVIETKDPNTVFVAALGHTWGPNVERGVFRTRDGGKTWKKVLFEDPDTGAIDLAISPSDPNVLFASMWQVRRRPWRLEDGGPGSGIYRSSDGGDHWQRLTQGLPHAPLGRIGIAIAPTNPRHIYALIEAHHGRLWASKDGGDHWELVSDDHSVDQRPFYFSRLTVAPDDENKVYFSAFNLMESDDGGKTTHAIGHRVHSDHHSLWIDPGDPRIMLQGNDGGAYVSHSGGKTWRYLDNLPIEQLYTVAAGGGMPYELCTGAQDNAAWCGPSSDLARAEVDGRDWFMLQNGDGQYAIPAPSNGDVIYDDTQLGYIERLNRVSGVSVPIRPSLLDSGDVPVAKLPYRFNWTSPIAVSPTDAKTVYLGGNVVFKTSDGGEHWQVLSPDLTRNDKSKQQLSGGPIEHDISGAEDYDTILSLALAPSDPRVIWAGTDDGLVWMSRDGEHWRNVTPPRAPPWARVYQIGVSPFNPGTAYLAFDAHMLDDRHPYVYKTQDFGRTWVSIGAGLPEDAAAVVIREDPNCRGLLMLGTDTGLFYSRDSGADWQPFGGNFPTVPVWDLTFIARDHALAVATHGRGVFVFDDLRPLEEINPAIEESALHLFSAVSGTLFHDHYIGRAAIPAYQVPNAPNGVVVSYYLNRRLETSKQQKKAGHTPVRIDIADTAGHSVNAVYGPAAAGLNQLVWPMNYRGPTPLNFIGKYGRDRSPSSGPEVLPGRYRVTVIVAGHRAEQWATVLPDPKLQVAADSLSRQTVLALRVDAELDAMNRMLNRLVALRDALHTAASGKGLGEPARRLDARLRALEESIFDPAMAEENDIGAHDLTDLQQQLGSLLDTATHPYGVAPSEAEMRLSSSLSLRLDGALEAFNGLLKTDVTAFNRMALKVGAPALPPTAAVQIQWISPL